MEIHDKNELWAKTEAALSQHAHHSTRPSNATDSANPAHPLGTSESHGGDDAGSGAFRALVDMFPEPVDEASTSLDMPRLRSALASLDPDCDERTWAYHRVAPLANAARDYPEQRGNLYELAWQFSSGKLAGKPAKTWTSAGKHGSPRRHRLASVWKKFLASTYKGTPAKIDSVFFHAYQQGWTGDNFHDQGVTQ